MCGYTCLIVQAEAKAREEIERSRHETHDKFLRARQKKKTVFEFVQTLRQLSAAVIGEPLDETTKITILREGLNVGPARTQLFRDSPETFEDACQIALNEDASQRRAHNTRVGPDSSTTHSPTPTHLIHRPDSLATIERCPLLQV